MPRDTTERREHQEADRRPTNERPDNEPGEREDPDDRVGPIGDRWRRREKYDE